MQSVIFNLPPTQIRTPEGIYFSAKLCGTCYHLQEAKNLYLSDCGSFFYVSTSHHLRFQKDWYSIFQVTAKCLVKRYDVRATTHRTQMKSKAPYVDLLCQVDTLGWITTTHVEILEPVYQ